MKAQIKVWNWNSLWVAARSKQSARRFLAYEEGQEFERGEYPSEVDLNSKIHFSYNACGDDLDVGPESDDGRMSFAEILEFYKSRNFQVPMTIVREC